MSRSRELTFLPLPSPPSLFDPSLSTPPLLSAPSQTAFSPASVTGATTTLPTQADRAKATRAGHEATLAKIAAAERNFVETKKEVVKQLDANASLSVSEKVKTLLDLNLRRHSCPLVDINEDAFVRIDDNPDLLALMYHLASNASSVDIDKFVELGTLVEAEDDEVDTDLYEVYIRIFTFPSDEDLRDTLHSYTLAFPADPGLESALLERLKDAPSFPFHVPYVGGTRETTPYGRVRDDAKALGASRLGNFLRVAGTDKLRVFAIPQAHIPVPSSTHILDAPLVGRTERFWIATSLGENLNSDVGGGHDDYLVAEDRQLFIDHKVTRRDLDDLLPPRDDPSNAEVVAKNERIERHLEDSYASRPLGGTKTSAVDLETQGGRTAYGGIMEDAKINDSRAGFVLSALYTSDITLSDVNGRTTFRAREVEQPVALAPAAYASLVTQLEGAPEDGSSLTPPRQDACMWTPSRLLPAQSFALSARLWRIIRPLLISSRSLEVTKILQSGVLAECVVDSEESRAFFAFADDYQSTPASFAKVLAEELPEWQVKSKDNATNVAGVVFIVRYGPGTQDVAIAVSIGDEGLSNHDPTLRIPFFALQSIALFVRNLALRVISEHLVGAEVPRAGEPGFYDWLVRVRAIVEERVISTGAAAALESRKAELRELQGALVGTRARAGIARAAAAQLDGGATEAEVAQQKSAKASRARLETSEPTFLGDPLPLTTLSHAFSPPSPSSHSSTSSSPAPLPQELDPKRVKDAVASLPRVRHLLDVLAKHRHALQTNASVGLAPSPRLHCVGTLQWVQWFLCGKGAIARSAGGTRPNSEASPEEKERRRAIHAVASSVDAAKRRSLAGVENIEEVAPVDVLKQLAGDAVDRTTGKAGRSRKSFAFVECEKCSGFFAGRFEKLAHLCVDDTTGERTRLRGEDPLLRRRRILFSRVYLQLARLDDVGISLLLDQAQLEPVLAATVLLNHRPTLLPILSSASLSSNVTIFLASTTPPHVAVDMAVDAILAGATDYEDQSDDHWWGSWKGAKATFDNIRASSSKPFAVARCEDCPTIVVAVAGRKSATHACQAVVEVMGSRSIMEDAVEKEGQGKLERRGKVTTAYDLTPLTSTSMLPRSLLRRLAFLIARGESGGVTYEMLLSWSAE